MVTRSGAGGSMPPAVGVITDRVIAKRPDLEGMLGFTVRAPPKLDIASAEGSIRVWVDPKGMGVEEGETSFPTVVLSAEELRTACQVSVDDTCPFSFRMRTECFRMRTEFGSVSECELSLGQFQNAN